MPAQTSSTGLNRPLVDKSLTALLNYLNKEKGRAATKGLLDDSEVEDQVYAVLGLAKVPSRGEYVYEYRVLFVHLKVSFVGRKVILDPL